MVVMIGIKRRGIVRRSMQIVKTYTVIAPNGTRYPATKYQVASQLANDIAKLMGSAEIEIKLTKEVENETN